MVNYSESFLTKEHGYPLVEGLRTRVLPRDGRAGLRRCAAARLRRAGSQENVCAAALRSAGLSENACAAALRRAGLSENVCAAALRRAGSAQSPAQRRVQLRCAGPRSCAAQLNSALRGFF